MPVFLDKVISCDGLIMVFIYEIYKLYFIIKAAPCNRTGSLNHQIKPIEDSKKTIAAIVQDRIREAIMAGTLPAGSRIDQARLASDLNVSIVPVREALKKLEAEGFVQI